MITFGLNYDVKPDFVKEFLKISNEALTVIQTMSGHIRTILYADVNHPNSFLIYSEWKTEEDFKNFIQSKEFKEVQSLSKDMLVSRPRHKIYESRAMKH